MDHARCTTCPIAGRCVQEWTGHARYCDWARMGGASLARVEGLSGAPAHPPAPEYPPLATQAGNLIGSLWAWALSGFSVSDRAERARRLEICLGCEFFDKAQGRCTQCGCVSNWKSRLASAHCPLNPPKW